MVVWWFKDGKPGHENQSLGLLSALGESRTLRTCEIVVSSGHPRHWWYLACARFPPGRDLPAPTLHVGAGHGTHLPMLAARRAHGGRIVVLMKPSLPLRCFDLCVVPEHDMTSAVPNVIKTRGVLNRLRPQNNPPGKTGLILVGGPSRHHDWLEDVLLEQLSSIVENDAEMGWTIATSPRTPSTTETALQRLTSERVELALFREVGATWLPVRLGRSSQVWVTEDSVSMVYEALTVGAAIGLLEVPSRRASRVSGAMTGLIRDGLVTPFDQWSGVRRLEPVSVPFDEASRCAKWIDTKWL